MDQRAIKEIRTKLGMSQEEFAAALGVSFATVNGSNNGKTKPQRDRILRMLSLSGDLTPRSCMLPAHTET